MQRTPSRLVTGIDHLPLGFGQQQPPDQILLSRLDSVVQRQVALVVDRPQIAAMALQQTQSVQLAFGGRAVGGATAFVVFQVDV